MPGIETTFLQTLSQFGFGIAVTLVLIFILIFVLKWVVKQQEKINSRANEREDKMMSIIESYQCVLKEIANRVREVGDKILTIGEFQRKEHNDLKEAFDRVEQTIKERL